MGEIIKQINDTRDKLNELVSEKDILLNDNEILETSRKLDDLIYTFLCVTKDE